MITTVYTVGWGGGAGWAEGLLFVVVVVVMVMNSSCSSGPVCDCLWYTLVCRALDGLRGFRDWLRAPRQTHTPVVYRDENARLKLLPPWCTRLDSRLAERSLTRSLIRAQQRARVPARAILRESTPIGANAKKRASTKRVRIRACGTRALSLSLFALCDFTLRVIGVAEQMGMGRMRSRHHRHRHH